MYDVRNEYFLWLVDRVDIGYVDVDEYQSLLLFLYDYDYYWRLELDANMAAHGLNLRYEFDPNMDLGIKNCSVLEMMVSLAWNWEHDITYDFMIGDRSGLWFWLMLENLGLLDEDDGGFDENRVRSVLDVWLDRRFEYDGNGSPFPLEHPNRDQRNLITWLQVNDFVMENVEI